MPSAVPQASLPIYDFGRFVSSHGEERQKTATEIVNAFKTYGFVYLVNHSISQNEINSLFDWSRKFFSLSEDERTRPELLCPATDPNQSGFVARGYTPVGLEKLSQKLEDNELKSLRAVPDAKDMFEMGPDKGIGAEREPNRYPPADVIPGFKDFTTDFFWSAHNLGMDILRCIAIGLGLDKNYFVDYHKDADNLFRLIRYPAVERAAMRAGTTARTTAHTDFGSITILFQDDVGGLEVEDPAKPGTYIVATPVEGSVIVNVGDFLMRWSNDVLKSNLHRVVEPPADRALPAGREITKQRLSVPFFIQADRKKVVQSIKELGGLGDKYPPVSAEEYLNMRRKATFKVF